MPSLFDLFAPWPPYGGDGTTVLATQTIASTTSTDTLGAAS